MEYPEKIVVEITQDDINNGERFNCFGCPLAMAAQHKFRVPHVQVSECYVDLYDSPISETQNLIASYSVDCVGGDFVRDFDAGRNVGPSKVTLYKIPRMPTKKKKLTT